MNSNKETMLGDVERRGTESNKVDNVEQNNVKLCVEKVKPKERTNSFLYTTTRFDNLEYKQLNQSTRLGKWPDFGRRSSLKREAEKGTKKEA